ncbi:hypothetical protein [Granulicoccus phenolivorans]|uniref:hypothetical protein n=1 Tax=Granulicoccus phenolivorans TaxID=266854 RepID=UPI00040F60ED|nr:hypothetical protein [Granulicoccus phenolivorans]
MKFDMVHSPDGIVADVDATVDALVERLGLPRPKHSWMQHSDSHGYAAMFARVHPSRALSPSRLEVISDYPQTRFGPTDISANIALVDRLQGERPVKTHATVLTTSDMDGLIAHLRERGVRHRVDPPSAELGHPRLWIGFGTDPAEPYEPADDAGLMMEFIPTQSLMLPDPWPAAEPIAEVVEGSAAMVRMAARSYIVRDVAATVATLADRVGWAAGAITGEPGSRSATMELANPRSAKFELIEPAADLDATQLFDAHGEGTFATRITVGDLEAKKRDLADRGTPFRELTWVDGRILLRVGPEVVPGFWVDFADERTEP